MRINAKILKNVVDINHYQYSTEARVSQDQANDIYIQLVDLDWSLNPNLEKNKLFPQYPIRHISSATVLSATAVFSSIDDSEEFEVVATQPFANDKSIFKFSLSSSQTPNAGNLIIKLNEDGVEKSFLIQQAVVVDFINKGGC